MSNQPKDNQAAGSDTRPLMLDKTDFESWQPQFADIIQLDTSFSTTNEVNQATVQNGRVVVQNVQGRQYKVQGNNARGAIVTGNGGAQNRADNANVGQG
ncbi:hypothetical protein Tco_1488329, partial [Tanacetum coccineum]